MSLQTGYWHSALSKRLSRRRAMALAGAAGVAAVAAGVACGSDENASTTEVAGDDGGLIYRPIETTKNATKGGMFRSYVTSDATSFDIFRYPGAGAIGHGSNVYSRLMRWKLGTRDKRSDGSVEADAAESVEISNGGLQVAFKLKQGLLFDPRAPTNSRPVDSEDVKYSWNRFAAEGVLRSDLVRAINQAAPVEAITTPDAKTVVFKLAFPFAPFTAAMAYAWYGMIAPREADDRFDLGKEMRGSGAWMLAKYSPSVSFEYRRNPGWYGTNKLYLDGFEQPIVGEYAARLAQFKSGALWTNSVRNEDVLQTKKDVPDLLLTQGDTYARNMSSMYFGEAPLSGSQPSPFLDERVRQACSMLLDRDLLIDTFGNVSKFEAQGLKVPTRWNSFVPAGEERFWIDPQGTELGEGSKFFKYDPAEAKKLLRAAGQTSAIETPFTSSAQQSSLQQQADAMGGMLTANGDFKLKQQVLQDIEFQKTYNQAHGRFPGISFTTWGVPYDIDSFLINQYHPAGGFSSVNDPKSEEFVTRQRQELDSAKRVQIIKDFQRYLTTKFFRIGFAGQALGFGLHWPAAGNWGVFNVWADGGWWQEVGSMIWHDKSKPPSA